MKRWIKFLTWNTVVAWVVIDGLFGITFMSSYLQNLIPFFMTLLALISFAVLIVLSFADYMLNEKGIDKVDGLNKLTKTTKPMKWVSNTVDVLLMLLLALFAFYYSATMLLISIIISYIVSQIKEKIYDKIHEIT